MKCINVDFIFMRTPDCQKYHTCTSWIFVKILSLPPIIRSSVPIFFYETSNVWISWNGSSSVLSCIKDLCVHSRNGFYLYKADNFFKGGIKQIYRQFTYFYCMNDKCIVVTVLVVLWKLSSTSSWARERCSSFGKSHRNLI